MHGGVCKQGSTRAATRRAHRHCADITMRVISTQLRRLCSAQQQPQPASPSCAQARAERIAAQQRQLSRTAGLSPSTCMAHARAAAQPHSASCAPRAARGGRRPAPAARDCAAARQPGQHPRSSTLARPHSNGSKYWRSWCGRQRVPGGSARRMARPGGTGAATRSGWSTRAKISTPSTSRGPGREKRVWSRMYTWRRGARAARRA